MNLVSISAKKAVMEVINISENGIESGLFGSVIAIGNFDGVHKGHQEIINRTIKKAQELKKPSAIFTFRPNPIEYFQNKNNYKITSFEQKCNIFNELGIDFVTYANFNEQFSKITAQQFIENLLIEKLKISYLFTGEDFKFGYKALGDKSLFHEYSKNKYFKYSPVEKILSKDGLRYSSTAARKDISNGDVNKVENILGRKFIIEGEVLSGAQQATKLGYPTANLSLDGYILPKYGVYNVTTTINGKKFQAIANIGVKPTYGNNQPLLEVHIFNFNQNIYGKVISIELNNFVRDEIKFNSIEDLKSQIEKDIKIVKNANNT